MSEGSLPQRATAASTGGGRRAGAVPGVRQPPRHSPWFEYHVPACVAVRMRGIGLLLLLSALGFAESLPGAALGVLIARSGVAGEC